MKSDVNRSLGRFVGLDEPKSLNTRFLQVGQIVSSRTGWAGSEGDTPVRMEMVDGYLLCLQRRPLPAYRYWVDGKPARSTSVSEGQFLFLDLNEEHAAIIESEVDCLSMFFSRTALDTFLEEHDIGGGLRLRTENGTAFDDPVVRSLGEALLPALGRPNPISKQSAEYVSTALLTHIAERYAESTPPSFGMGRKLERWQESRAKEMLIGSKGPELGLEELARGCGMTRVAFLRAFTATVGMGPCAWLLTQRIERARDLLESSDLSISDISDICGFGSSEEFRRQFAGVYSMTPAYWRSHRPR